MEHVILYAVPVFLALIGLELIVDRRRKAGCYRLNDAISNLSLGILSQISGAYTKLFAVGFYIWAYDHWAWRPLPANDWRTWALAMIAYDFFYYWVHRCGHELNIMWAAHVVHHSSEEYNLTVALRQTSSGFLVSWIFYLPMALAGIPPAVFVASGLINLLYQYWIHTKLIGKLGWFDYVFASPSNHRVHHGQNDYCIDRNYGGLLMVWDHLFGSFAMERENEPILYGIRGQLGSFNPIRANLHIYRDMGRDMILAGNWREALQVLIKPPGWRPRAAAEKAPKPAWSLAGFHLYDPPFQGVRRARTFALFCVLFLAAAAWIGVEALLPFKMGLGIALAVTGGLWLVAAMMERERTA